MAAQRAILDVLHSQRWTVTARTSREQCYERQFGEAFAAFVGRRFGIPCSSGTAALTIALQALKIGPGDEVIVPGMTWVACASSVINLGAIPILVDVDQDSLCMSPDAVRHAITTSTRAVMAVHMYSSRADMAQLQTICDLHGIEMIEDASQAHGAMLDSRRVGAFGRISVFSFQQTKLLTSGEGGIVLTDDSDLYERLQQLRADGRSYSNEESWGFHDLLDKGDIMGRNLCLSEFHAAILLEGLQRLLRENEHRRAMAAMLNARLADLGGVTLVGDTQTPDNGSTFYKIPLRFTCDKFLALGPERLAKALTAELLLAVEPLDRPLNNNPLYRPLTSRLVTSTPDLAARCDPARYELAVATVAWQSCIGLPHQCLLGGEPEIDAIVAALAKIREQADSLIDAWPEHGSDK
jgi:L-glutamine:scyllo-inosose aminotransferase/L-glutamine:2-deoxy-scyllo-inosose/3-amino-2,3-dideoxy-scyllo-inosose aminotransferase